tara:strand:- start:14 stop:148 length:135 start_codon:yes stop_codon:yes gene_type:complete
MPVFSVTTEVVVIPLLAAVAKLPCQAVVAVKLTLAVILVAELVC